MMGISKRDKTVLSRKRTGLWREACARPRAGPELRLSPVIYADAHVKDDRVTDTGGQRNSVPTVR